MGYKMAGKPIGTIFVELSLDDKVYKQRLSETLTGAQATAKGIETSWKALGSKSDAVYDAQRRSAENAYTLIKTSALSTEADKVRALEASSAKIKSINEQQFGHQATLMESVKKNWMALSASIIGAYYSMQKFYDLSERGAKVRAFEEGFAAMSVNFGIVGDALIGKLKKVTKETIDDSDLMAKALRLISEGFSEEQMVGIGEAARVSARLTGKTVTEAYESISDSLINLRERGLKTAGIIIDMDKAETKHAATLGVAKEQLSDYGKRMAWASGIMEKTKEDAAKLGKSLDGLNQYERFQKGQAAWKDFGDTISKWAAGAIADIRGVIDLTKSLFDLSSKGLPRVEWPKGGGKFGGPNEMSYLDILKFMFGDQATRHKMAAERMPSYEAPPLGSIGEKPSPIKTGIIDKEKEAAHKRWLEQLGREAEIYERINGLVQEEGAFWVDNKERLDIQAKSLEKIRDIEGGIVQQMADDMFPSIEKVNKAIDQGNQYFEEQRKILIEINNLVLANDWSDIAAGLRDAASDATRELTKMAMVIPEAMKTTNQFMQGLGETISSSISGAMTSMIMGSQSAAEALKQIWSSIASYVIEQITKMLMNWILFQNATGTYESGKGLLGTVGSLLGIAGGSPSLSSSGGRYAPAYASGGRGQNAPMGGGPVQIDNSTHNMYINAVDADSFEKKYGSSVTKIMRKNYRLNGDVKNMTR
jgi:hypothetical protein